MFKRLSTILASLMLSITALAYSYGTWEYLGSTGSAHGYEEGRSLYVCKAHAHGGVHPGKVVAGQCNIGYGGNEEVYSEYDIYTGSGQWLDSSACSERAVVGGFERGRALAVCLASAHGGFHPGKVVADKCNIGYGGREEIYEIYSVLVE